MEMEEAFNSMLGSLHAVHAGRSQVAGVLAWRESACAAAARGRALGERAFVPGAGVTVTHGRWMAVCGRIVGALRVMEQQAEYKSADSGAAASAAEKDRERLMSAASSAADEGLRRSLLGQAMDAERSRRKWQAEHDQAQEWRRWCNDAAAQGQFLARSQDAVLAPVVQTVADNGGLAETALDKTYHDLGSMR